MRKSVMDVQGRCAAFTLVELLVTLGVVSMLASLATVGVQSSLVAARRTKEIHAARQVVAAYVRAPLDNNGRYLPGYDRTVGELNWPDGTAVYGPVANRYPYRIAEYLDYQFGGTLFVNKNAVQVDASDSYSTSLLPAFAFNYLYVGGDVAADGTITISHECVTRTADGANILAFASGGFRASVGSEIIHGYNILTPPRVYGPMWKTQAWKEDASPGDYGNVHARHNGKAVCGFLDGSVTLLSIEELRDMRLWSKAAKATDNPDYSVSPVSPPPRGR